MMTQRSEAEALPQYRVRTHNASEHSENRMHSDEVARQFGFKAALVPGVTVFAHMTRPLVARYGEAWLERGIAEVSFSKPAYEGELLTVTSLPDPGGGGHEPSGSRPSTVGSGGRLRGSDVRLACTNEDGVELARMTTFIPASSPEVDPRSEMPPAPPIRERPIVTWELMEIGKPFPALRWTPTAADNARWCEDARDDLALYRASESAPLHPGLVLRQANFVLRNRFTLPAWIHTGSRIVFRSLLELGREYEVRAIPDEKWERKGHEFVRLYVAIRCGGKTMAEVMHTAIFRPRPAPGSARGAAR